jgi:hypothetical protein
MIYIHEAWHGEAGRGGAWQGWAWQGWAWQGEAWRLWASYKKPIHTQTNERR